MSLNNQYHLEDSRPEGLSESIARLRRAMRRAARIADPGNPLTVAQLEVLSALVENSGIRPGNLAGLLHMQPNTVSTIVNALQDKNMVDRMPAGSDGRAVELHTTDLGKQAVLKWEALNISIVGQALSTLSAPQRRLLVSAIPSLNAVTKAIEASNSNG